MKKTKLMIAMCIVAVALTGCGGKDGASKNDKSGGKDAATNEAIVSEIDNYVYKCEPIDIGKPVGDEYLGSVKIAGEYVFAPYIRYIYQENAMDNGDMQALDAENIEVQEDVAEDVTAEEFDAQEAGYTQEEYAEYNAGQGTVEMRLVRKGLDGSDQGEYKFQYPDNKNFVDYCSDENGNLYLLSQEYSFDEMGGKDVFSISARDKEGKELWSKEIEPKSQSSDTYFYVQSLKQSGDNLYAMSTTGILVYDMSGELKKTVGENNDLDWGSASILKDGTVAVFDYSKENAEIVEYDLQTGNKIGNIEIPVSLWGYSLNAGNMHEFLLSNSTGLYYYDRGDKEIHKFIDYVASDLCCYNIYNTVEVDDNTFYGCFYDDFTDDGGVVTAKFTKVDPSTVASKKSLTLGGMFIGSDVKRNVIRFNRSSDESRIVIKDYSAYVTSDDFEDVLKAINNDIIAGTTPDIMILNTNMNITNYIAKGAFEPLDSYLDSDNEIKRSDYMENVFDAMSYDGKLYCITPSFNVNTMVGKKSVVGDKNLSLDELQKIAEDIGPDTKVFNMMTKENFIRNIMYYDQDEFVDMASGEVYFDSENFIKMLEYTDKLPVEVENNEEDWEYNDAAFRENRAIVTLMSMYDFRDSLSYYRYVLFGEELGYIGFPCSNHSGTSIGFDNAFAISEASQNKDAAWEFIRAYLTDDFQKNISWGFPVKKSVLREKGIEQTKPYTYIDENGEEQIVKDTYYIGNKEVEAEPPTEAEIDEYIEFLKTADMLVNYNESITDIILEEAQSYFNGQKSADSVAKVIQSRVQIYVNENR